MFYHPETDTYIREGAGFSLNGVDYPPVWLNLSSPEDKEALGLVEVVVIGERANERTHFITEELVGAEKRIINTPKPDEMLEALDSTEREVELTRMRTLREQILDRLSGIAGRASRKGNIELSTACDNASEALLDITNDLPTDCAGTKAAIEQRYKLLAYAAISAAPSLESAFAQIDQ